MPLGDVSDDVAERLLAGYRKHLATRFPIVHSVWVEDLHRRRGSLSDPFERCVLHLVYAASGRFIETTGEKGNFAFKDHFNSGISMLDVVFGDVGIRTVQVLMLMAIYCLRDAVGPGAWICSRTAMLLAIDCGLHRQTKNIAQRNFEGELRKRLFWTCYCFDRQISIPMGRPFGISDRDIDLELPFDVDESLTEERFEVWRSSKVHIDRISTLTSFIKIAELRRIESEIQQCIYRVDSTIPPEDSVIDGFLNSLSRWKEGIPAETHLFKDDGDTPYDGYDYYVSKAHQTCGRDHF